MLLFNFHTPHTFELKSCVIFVQRRSLCKTAGLEKSPRAHLNEVNLFSTPCNIKEIEWKTPVLGLVFSAAAPLHFPPMILKRAVVDGFNSPVLTSCSPKTFNHSVLCFFLQTGQTEDPHEEAHG